MKPLFVVVGFLVGVILVLLMPLAVIWSLNTLFPVLAIPYTLETWLAVILLSTVPILSVRK